MKKILYIVLDGLGDRPTPALGNRTPLEAANTPVMDKLARMGENGVMYTVAPGIAPESDIAVISILGYDAYKYYTGRGPLESHAVGLKVSLGDLAYRVNFGTMGDGRKIIDRRVGRNLTTAEADELCREINERVKLTSVPGASFEFKNTIEHRGVLVIRCGGKLSAMVSNTDPAYGREGLLGVALEKFEDIVQTCVPLDDAKNSEAAKMSAKLTNEFVDKSHEVLEQAEVNAKRRAQGKMPGNLILTRDGGDRLPKMPPISEQFGVQFGCFQEMPVEKGIAMLTGMDIVPVPQASGNPERDYPYLAKKAAEELPKYGGLYIHIKGPDLPGHDGLAEKKRDIIEAIDRFFLANLVPSLDFSDVVLTLTADHSTPCILKAHSADPVPLLILDSSLKPDGTKAYTEAECAKGKLGTIRGIQLLPRLVELARGK
ncbi:MAG: 2,3-bisphosphoglycerate-independent phosphoglycerate mutase [Candidatus Abyssobacteria bacterium SURF_17]|uniref:2,3-bisphosphoglycerate-independent phosphoglycerate mutase n=1 Tax=Candidatus Abyssobacteria bacterium SURF_17 TaxID=2093361 RepID=A0A419EVX8_9BACT|nr:MAG: 2,3-bisphosphoglycerate-independent phosphoglycerate mutase [Candidatus Abyssubacteria bacterium SURF_17]